MVTELPLQMMLQPCLHVSLLLLLSPPRSAWATLAPCSIHCGTSKEVNRCVYCCATASHRALEGTVHSGTSNEVKSRGEGACFLKEEEEEEEEMGIRAGVRGLRLL